jgi:cyclic nucleotide-binding protein
MQGTDYIVPARHGVTNESLRAGKVLEKNPPVNPPETRHAHVFEPIAARTVSIATIGCLLSACLVPLVCSLLTGLPGMVVAGAVVIYTANTVSRMIVKLGSHDDRTADPVPYGATAPARTPETHPRWEEGQMAGNGEKSSRLPFWEALNTEERRDFTSAAIERIFAGGATLMTEGERADHVILIRDGFTRICVNEQGRERVIAKRGPGQLVGERAALQVNLRSASVIALETVHALVMRTEDFAHFVGAHPRVLDIVESQVYDRLTTPPDDLGHHGDLAPVRADERERPAETGRFNGEHCTVLFTDVAGFGAHVRNDDDRRLVRETSAGLVREAFAAQGVAWESCHVEDRGDGLLIVVPARIPTRTVIEGLPDRLKAALKRHNRRSAPPVRIQLRLAVDVGPVTTDTVGQGGSAIIRAARLLDAPVLKRSLKTTAADLGVIVSKFVYESVVCQSDPDGFEHVRVKVKESRLDAWMWLAPPPSGTS